MSKEKVKQMAKQVLTKLPVFIFCVLFINGYNALFGTENSIVGVVLLMGTLMFLKADFGWDVRFSAVAIPVLFVLMGACAKLSRLNPWLGLVVNLATILIFLSFCRYDKSRSLYLPYLMGYIMLGGYDVSGDVFTSRMISLAVVGVLIGLIYYLANKKTPTRRPIADIVAPITPEHPWCRWAITLVFTLSLTIFAGDFSGFPKTMWVNLTVLSLVSPLEEEIKMRKLSRVPATILGCVVFFGLYQCLIPPDYQLIVVLVAGFLSMFITSYFIKTIYNSFSALVTATLLIPTGDAILFRIIGNVIGAVLAIVSSFVFSQIFSRWARRQGVTELAD